MEHFITTIFWIVILSGYSQEAPTVNTAKTIFKQMSAEIQCPTDSTFYTPENVKKHCIAGALECAMKELNGTVRAECTGHRQRINKGFKTLNASLKKWNAKHHTHVLLNPNECACEAWPQVSFDKFLLSIATLTELAAASST